MVRDRLWKVATGLEKTHTTSGDSVKALPKGGLTIFLDCADIRFRPEYQHRRIDLVVGKVENDNMCGRFGLVANATASPGSRKRRELLGFGWKPGRLLTVISDGELALSRLVAHFDACAAYRGSRSGARPDKWLCRQSNAVPAPREKPSLMILAL